MWSVRFASSRRRKPFAPPLYFSVRAAERPIICIRRENRENKSADTYTAIVICGYRDTVVNCRVFRVAMLRE